MWLLKAAGYLLQAWLFVRGIFLSAHDLGILHEGEVTQQNSDLLANNKALRAEEAVSLAPKQSREEKLRDLREGKV
jgi:hypothetical protein